MTTWMMVLALAAATDGANARERLVAAMSAQHIERVQVDAVLPAPAEASLWTYLGPEEALLSALAISPSDPDHMLATNSYLWGIPLQGWTMQTHSGGQQWVAVAPLRDVMGKIAFMSNGRAIVASPQGVYSLAPGAPSWTHHVHPGTGQAFQVEHVAMGGASGPVWVSGELAGEKRVFRIDDLGTSWVDAAPPVPADAYIRGLAASPDQPGVAVVAFGAWTGRLRTLVTIDSGANWVENEAEPGWVGAVNVFELHGNRLFAGVSTSGGFNGLYVGEDLGASWTPAYGGGGSNHAVFDVAVDANDHSRLWIVTDRGLRHSTDGGASWNQGSHDISGLRASQVSYDPTQSRLWVALDWYGVWMSADDGESFERRSHGLNTMPSTAIALDPGNPAQVAVALQTELEPWGGLGTSMTASVDGGLSWPLTLHQPSGIHGARPWFHTDGMLYAAFGDGSATRVRRRVAGGTWELVHPSGYSFAPAGVRDIVPGDGPGTLVMSARRFHYVNQIHESELHRFDADDMAWTQVVDGAVDGGGFTLARVDAAGDLRLLALEHIDPGEGHGRLLGSDDDGRTWVELHQGLGAWNGGALCVGDDRRVMIVLEEAGRPWLYRSIDAGDSWTRTAWIASSQQEVGAPFASLHCPGDGQQVFMGDQRGNLWWSTDAGDSFTARAADAGTWGLVDIRDIQSSIVGLYVANKNGLWVNTALARPSQRPLELGVSIAGARMRTLATLNWEGGLSRVEIRRNGAVVAEVDNTGSHVDAMLTPLRPPTLQWQVCNAGTWECSDPVTD